MAVSVPRAHARSITFIGGDTDTATELDFTETWIYTAVQTTANATRKSVGSVRCV